MTWGLVLGGGGVVGIAWEAGVVAGLADHGVDLAAAEVVVGTSAGSVIGTQLRSGWSVEEIGDAARGRREVTVDTDALAAPPVDGDPNAVREVFRRWIRVDDIDEAQAREIAQLAATAPTMAESSLLALTGSAVPEAWPARELRITGVSVATGRRVAWTARDGVPLRHAIAASCSVPGLFPPVTIGDDRYVDGGLWSGSNADLLLDDGLDAVLFVGPLAGEEGIGRVASRSFARELDTLRGAGIATFALTPREPFVGTSLMDPTQRESAYDIGRADAAAAADEVARLVAAPVAR
jgi:NTE family protein